MSRINNFNISVPSCEYWILMGSILGSVFKPSKFLDFLEALQESEMYLCLNVMLAKLAFITLCKNITLI